MEGGNVASELMGEHNGTGLLQGDNIPVRQANHVTLVDQNKNGQTSCPVKHKKNTFHQN